VKKLLTIVAAIVAFASCKKDKDTSSIPTVKDGFTWKEDGGAEITADSAFWTTWGAGTGVRAYKGGNANFFEINWNGAGSTAVTTYTLAPGGGVTFLKGTNIYTNTSKEILTITAFSNDKLSGNFTAGLSGGSVKSISVVFTNLPKK